MNNRTMIEKAAMMLSDLSTGGLMNTTQFNTFYRKIIDTPTILREARMITMPIDSMKIEKIGFGQRVLKPGVEGVALADADRSKPTTSTITLNAKEVIAEVNITYDTLENNIEGEGLRDTIMTLLAERVALDLEELVINGDTSSSDTYLKLIDGLRKQAVSHIYDHAGATISKDVFKKTYAKVPTKYVRNPAEYRFYTSYSNELEWKDSIVARQTALGDNMLTTAGVANAYGVPVKGIAMLQAYDLDGAGAGTDMGSDVLFTHPKNILVGFSRNVRVEVDKDIRERKFIVVLTAKIDTLFEEEDAVAKAIKVKHAL